MISISFLDVFYLCCFEIDVNLINYKNIIFICFKYTVNQKLCKRLVTTKTTKTPKLWWYSHFMFIVFTKRDTTERCWENKCIKTSYSSKIWHIICIIIYLNKLFYVNSILETGVGQSWHLNLFTMFQTIWFPFICQFFSHQIRKFVLTDLIEHP